MAHTKVRATPASFTVELAARGRLVVPSAARKQIGLNEGDALVLTVEDDGSLRVRRLEEQVRRLQGAYKRAGGGRSLSAELIRERREEAKREGRR